MKMTELAIQYRETAAVFAERIQSLQERLKTEKMSETEKMRLRIRIETLQDMRRDLIEVAYVMERYYDRRYKKNARYSV